MKSTWERKEVNTKRIAIVVSVLLHILVFVALSGSNSDKEWHDTSQPAVEQVADNDRS